MLVWVICVISIASAVILIALFGVALKIYMKLTIGWCKNKTTLAGKTAVVTGANAGIGYETALDFAMRGARVILACRDSKRGEDARVKIVQQTGNNNVVLRLVDMASFSSVRTFAKNINETETRLDILVNNAGVIGIENSTTEDGHVLLMQVNYFSQFLVTILLLGLLKNTTDSRIVNVASVSAAFATNFDVEKVDTFPGQLAAYHNSKLCNVLFTIELAKRLKGTEVTTYSLHPGAVKSDIFRYLKGVAKIFTFIANLFYRTCEEGAQTTIYCSVAKDIEHYSGEHFAECRRVKPYNTTKKNGLSERLWEITERIVQLGPEEV